MRLRFGCRDCDWVGTQDEIDLVKDTKSETRWSICPGCRSAEQFDNLCDEEGCDNMATCGWPSKDKGYRRTCYHHWIY